MITDTTYYTKGRIVYNTKIKPLACCEDRMRRWLYTSQEAFSLGTASARTLILDFTRAVDSRVDVCGGSVRPECKFSFEN